MKSNLRSWLIRRGALVFFVIYALVGLLVFDDYGCGPDEGMERQTSLVNYRYALEKLHLPVSQPVKTWLAYLPPLKEYRDRYYGTALHFPLVLIESAFHFQLEPAQFYGMRHFYTFLNFYLAMICFYRLLRKRFADSLLPLAGVILFVTTPRFFAESFYNNKDVLFLAWYILAICFTLRWFEKQSAGAAVVAGIVLALMVNTRLNGIVLIPLLILFALFGQIARKSPSRRMLWTGILLFAVFLVSYYLITPNLWESPLRTFSETFAFNQKHPNHGSEGNLFFGRLVDTTKVWYFLPVWMGITIPPLTMLLFFAGTLIVPLNFFREGLPFFKSKTHFMDAFIFCAGFVPLAVIIAMKVIVYNGWRHTYFFYATIVYLALVGADALLRLPLHSRTLASARTGFLSLCLILPMLSCFAFILRNHPYEYVYFAPPLREHTQLFSGDYWGMAGKDMLRYVLETDDRPHIVVDHEFTNAGSINRGLFPEPERAQLEMVYGTDTADYILWSRDDKSFDTASFSGFEKVFSIRVDTDEIAIVLKKQEGSVP